jgi:cytochrome c oxidase subunit 2
MKRSIRFAAGLCLAAGLVAWTVAPATAAGDVERGEELFHQLCSQCHGSEGEGFRLALAPSIAGLPEWYVQRQLDGFRAGHRGRHFDDISGMRMRPMARVLEAEDVAHTAAFVASMPIAHPEPELEGGDATKGQALYAPCIACHGLDGTGNQALGSPPINHQNDWYLLTQLQHFKAGVRGTAPGDMQGALMRPMSMTLADEQAMKDVIAFIMTLSKTQAAK